MTTSILRILFITGLLSISIRTTVASDNSSFTSSTSSTDSTVYGAILLVVSILSVLCNFTVVFVILKTDSPDVSSLIVIAHMAFWDLLFGMIFLVSSTPSAFLNRFAYTESMIFWLVCLGSFVTGVAILNTVTILADRFISLKWPFFHRKHATKWKYAFTFCFVYMLSFIRTLLIVLPAEDFIYDNITALCRPTFNTNQGTVASSGPVAFSFGIIIIFSCYILMVKRRRMRRVRPELVVPISGNVMKRSLICVLSAGVFCLSYLPVVLRVVLNVAFHNTLIDDIFTKFATVSYLSNSIWNVVIYSLNYMPFREACLKLLCRSYYRKIKRHNQLQKAGRTGVFRLSVTNNRVVLANNSSVTPLESVPRANT